MTKKIVLTGGPCGGKSTIINALRNKLRNQIIIVPEAATILFGGHPVGGFPVPNKDICWSTKWQACFQAAVTHTAIGLEDTWELKATRDNIKLLICDRGILDGAAYTHGGLEEFCQIYSINYQTALTRYFMVIHIETLAITKPQLYGSKNNSVRFENLKEAKKRDYLLREIWQAHPNWYFVNHYKEQDRTNAVYQIIKNHI